MADTTARVRTPATKRCALAAIVLYQRYVSPLKGFSCAYRAHSGGPSCSALGYRAIRRYGVWKGLGTLKARLHRCGVAHRRYTPAAGARHQRGFCDGCDLPCDVDCAGGVLDAMSCTPCDCSGWPWRRKHDEQKSDKYVYIPPHRQLLP
jgi:putative component of membrane protein insertase Oxa1/YidC/SpoIIIJ protein YidD